MAIIIPTINSCSGKITAGEKRLARIFESNLSDDAICWYDIPTGEAHRHPDFIVFSPEIGIFFIEVKDWFASRIKSICKSHLVYESQDGSITHQNPIEQVRRYAFETTNSLKKDPQLIQEKERYKGNFCLPYGYGVYLSNITRKQFNQLFPDETSKSVLPSELVICKDELTEFMSAEKITARLKKLIPHYFPFSVTSEQINRIRWILYPEIRIGNASQNSTDETDTTYKLSTPNIMKIMDTQQELLARSLGEGHRVIHGVAGSGKTLILLYRCQHLLKNSNVCQKPILVICYNITLARKLSALIRSQLPNANVKVIHFHSWCVRQVKFHNVPVKEKFEFPKNYEVALKEGFQSGKIPSEQYSAVLIDEGHDFDSEWLKILSKMTAQETNSLLFLYDDTQSIYKKRNALSFSLASVGIQAQGRTSILKLNYRNTQQILHFASGIAFNYLNAHCSEEFYYDKPDAGGDIGPYPIVKKLKTHEDEVNYVAQWLTKEHKNGIAWHDMAILCPSTKCLPDNIVKVLENKSIPFNLIIKSNDKKKYDPLENKVCIMPLPSSKGLEFHSVAVIDSCNSSSKEDDLSDDIKKLYVGFTRATRHLLVTFNRDNKLSEHIISTYEKMTDQHLVS
ncbi:UvrD-helicase domain-containing protein [Serratia fonticola]|uniref:UvrD-helicase domain-containing protein n=1 Tax=Serratia fonticola TaxID=47917 RepID=UPI001AE8A3E5|nr:UvrD-helicase domain-containing protein [Serratia fonticola]MBP1004831.1 UvrD-helicase domain-containing protein [Serratia fonticola]MBP1014508.1 UvrD-helicase domain-containing protein [Serratia fonticola]MBP1016842.1 UvrD-helicase domain-containing protein [Serratia fonticola]